MSLAGQFTPEEERGNRITLAVVILQDRRGRECKTGSILIAQELTDDFPLYNSFFVEDVAASLDFFTRAFGLKTGFLHDGGDYGELATGGTKLAFSSRALMRQLAKSPAPADAARPVFEVALETDSVPGALDRAVSAGAGLIQAAREEPWGQVTSYVSDPDGYLAEICSAIQLPGPG